jgi:hypothetical protein
MQWTRQESQMTAPSMTPPREVEMKEFIQEYYWVVLCKNHRIHHRQNRFSDHKILLGLTDAFSPLPMLNAPIRVTCDDCGREYSYLPSEVLRCETEPPASLAAHPLFSGPASL